MNIHLDEAKSILYVKPNSALTVEDFSKLTTLLDAYLKTHDFLKGLVIETLKFPGWKNPQAFMAHVKFIKNHQAKIQKVAVVTDSNFATIGKTLIGPFVNPQLQHFPYDKVELAKQWIEQ